MLNVDNYALAPYSAGTIQMVPGIAGYEPVIRDDNPDQEDSSQLRQNARQQFARQQSIRQLEEAYDTTYNQQRRLSSSAASNIGTFIDIYG